MNLPLTLQRKACFLKSFLELTNLYCSSLFYGIMISTIWLLKIHTLSGLFKQLAEIWKTWLLNCWNLKKIIVPQMCNFLEQKQSKKEIILIIKISKLISWYQGWCMTITWNQGYKGSQGIAAATGLYNIVIINITGRVRIYHRVTSNHNRIIGIWLAM